MAASLFLSSLEGFYSFTSLTYSWTTTSFWASGVGILTTTGHQQQMTKAMVNNLLFLSVSFSACTSILFCRILEIGTYVIVANYLLWFYRDSRVGSDVLISLRHELDYILLGPEVLCFLYNKHMAPWQFHVNLIYYNNWGCSRLQRNTVLEFTQLIKF